MELFSIWQFVRVKIAIPGQVGCPGRKGHIVVAAAGRLFPVTAPGYTELTPPPFFSYYSPHSCQLLLCIELGPSLEIKGKIRPPPALEIYSPKVPRKSGSLI